MWAPSKRSSCCHRFRCTGCSQRTKSLQLYDHMYCTKRSNEEQWVHNTLMFLSYMLFMYGTLRILHSTKGTLSHTCCGKSPFSICALMSTVAALCSGSGSLFHCHNHRGIWVLDMKFKANKSTNFDQSFAGFPLQKVESFREKTTTTHLQE
jgi:hypothetical protein